MAPCPESIRAELQEVMESTPRWCPGTAQAALLISFELTGEEGGEKKSAKDADIEGERSDCKKPLIAAVMLKACKMVQVCNGTIEAQTALPEMGTELCMQFQQ